MGVALVVFLFSGTKNKRPQDYIIITALLLANTFAATALALDKLEVL